MVFNHITTIQLVSRWSIMDVTYQEPNDVWALQLFWSYNLSGKTYIWGENNVGIVKHVLLFESPEDSTDHVIQSRY